MEDGILYVHYGRILTGYDDDYHTNFAESIDEPLISEPEWICIPMLRYEINIAKPLDRIPCLQGCIWTLCELQGSLNKGLF